MARAMLLPPGMENGKNHEQRSAHVRAPRHNNTPPVETAPSRSGGHGSEVAPTPKAVEENAIRHAEEEANGHFAAGVDGRTKAIDVPERAEDEALQASGTDSTHVDDPPSDPHTTAPASDPAEGEDEQVVQPGEDEGTQPTPGSAAGPRH
jgi:hypothetical protein